MNHGLLVLGGFLLGTAGMKIATSRPVKKAAVRVTACGLQMKDYVNYVVAETKAQYDDIMAEAVALKEAEDAGKTAEHAVIGDDETVVEITEEAIAEEPEETPNAKQGTEQ